MASSGSNENNTLQYPQGLIPGLNYVPAAFSMPANGELPLGGQTMMHPLQQLGAMPFFGQGGGQFLMPASGMPVFLHPGFTGAMQMATSPQSQNSSQTSQQGRDGASRTDNGQQQVGTADGTPLPFPGVFPQQLQFFGHLPQLYMQPSMQLPASSNGEQSVSLQANAGVDVASATVFPEGFVGMSMPGFSIPMAFPGLSPAGIPQHAASLSAVPAAMSVPAAQKEDPTKGLKPPKRPLTPYMRFSKAMWTTVKSSYPDMTVCEIGATIGRLWRELTNEQKEKYNEDFMQDKVRYDDELQQYLKVTGLHASDVNKSAKKKKEPAASSSKASSNKSASNHTSSSHSQQQQTQQQSTALAGSLLMPGQPAANGSNMGQWLM